MRIPRPASDRVVDESGPDQHEDNAGKHTASLCNSTNGESHTIHEMSITSIIWYLKDIIVRDSGKHALVHGEHEIRDPVATNGRRC